MGNTRIPAYITDETFGRIPTSNDLSPTLISDEPKKSVELTGNSLFKDTLAVATPAVAEKKQTQISSSPLFDWMSSFFSYFSANTPTPAPEIAAVETITKPALPARPELEQPAPEAREQMLKILEATKQSNRIAQIIQEDLQDKDEAHVYRKTVSLFKEVITLNEQFVKTSMEDNKGRNEIIKNLNSKYHELKEEIRSVQTKETIAKTTQTALTLFAIGTVACLITGAAIATATGFVPAFYPALIQAMSTTGYATTHAISTVGQAGTLAYRTHLEGIQEKHKSELIQRNHDQDSVYLEIKVSREEWNQFVQIVTNLWTSLRQIDDKRREANKLEA